MKTSILALAALVAASALAGPVSAQSFFVRAKGSVPAAPPAACAVAPVGTVPAAKVGSSFALSFRTTQPVNAPLGHSVVGELPPGVTFNKATSAIVGTPTVAGTYGPLRIVVDTRAGMSGEFCKTEEFSISVAPQFASCSTPWGQSVEHGQSTSAYLSATVPFGSSCSGVAETRTCSDGILSGTASLTSCAELSPASCSAPWNQSVAHGQTVTAFTASTVAFGTSCAAVQQSRTCSNGTLSGSASNASCSVAAPTYAWSAGSFGSCSATCGGGTQSRAVSCLRQDGVAVADLNCASPKPATTQSCNTQSCQKTCGSMQYRTTTSNGTQYDQSRIYDMNQCRTHCQAYSGIAACIWNSTGLCTRMSEASGLTSQHPGSWSTQTLYAAMCY
jgi:hypothetical protein